MGALKKAVFTVFVWDFGVRIVALFGKWLLVERYAPLSFIAVFLRHNFLLWSWSNFDGEHYLAIAAFGYHIRNGFPEYAFFPLYPLLIKVLSFIIRDYLLAGLLVSQLSLVAALYYMARWAALRHVKLSPWLLLLSPGAVFLAATYTEPLFIALAAATIVSADQKQWGRATIITALATATRVNGIFLVAFLAIRMWQSHVPILRTAYCLLLAALGLLSYMAFLFWKIGDPLAWYHAQSAWGKATATSPLVTIASYIRAISTDFHPDLTHLVVIFEVVVTVIALTLFIYALKKRLFDLSYLVYLGGNLFLPLATGSLGSMPRFYLTLFPLLAAVPLLPKLPRTMYYGLSASIAVVGVILFTRGYWFA